MILFVIYNILEWDKKYGISRFVNKLLLAICLCDIEYLFSFRLRILIS